MVEYTTTSAIVTLVGVGLGTLVVVCYLVFIWWLDRYEREPLWLVAVVFAYGALGSTCLGIIVSAPLSMLAHGLAGPEVGGILTTVVVAPIAEELTKGLVFIPLVLTAHFDNETDGLIYGAAVGLGFAALENLLYYGMVAPAGAGAVLGTVLVRTLFTTLVHCVSSALLGMCIGWARHRSGAGRWLIWPLLGYFLACLNHGLWNGLAVAAGGIGPAAILLGMALVAGTSVLMFALTQLSLKREHDVIRRFLHAEAARGVLPAAHAEIIPYWTRRRAPGWLAEHVPKEAYLRAATLLAFRHHQLEIAAGERQRRYEADIHKLRAEVRRLLHGGAPSLIPARGIVQAIPLATVVTRPRPD
jgi:protease PrsW